MKILSGTNFWNFFTGSVIRWGEISPLGYFFVVGRIFPKDRSKFT
jgi:hypothetical protein